MELLALDFDTNSFWFGCMVLPEILFHALSSLTEQLYLLAIEPRLSPYFTVCCPLTAVLVLALLLLLVLDFEALDFALG